MVISIRKQFDEIGEPVTRIMLTVHQGRIQYAKVQCSAVQCSTVLCSVVQYSTVQYSTVRYGIGDYSVGSHLRENRCADIWELGNKFIKIPWQQVIQNKNIQCMYSELSVKLMRNVQWLK